MKFAGSQSWLINVERWSETYDLPLWIRAAERLDVAGDVVPGPLDIDPVPSPTTGPDAELSAGWAAWWAAVVREPRWRASAAGPPRPDLSFAPPGFPGLNAWPALRDVAAARWPEAHDWHTSRKRTGLDLHLPPRLAENQVVRQVERELRRTVKPFVLEFIVLPVRDEEIRRVHETRYLVSERIYDGPGWSSLLRPLVTRLGA